MGHEEFSYIGKGIYSMKEASMLTGVKWAKVRHWVRGDKRTEAGTRTPVGPVIKPDFGKIDNVYLLSFLDMIEVLMIEQFLTQGISLQSVRKAHRMAMGLFNTNHPFALRKFWSDGRHILADVGSETKDPGLLNLKESQYEIRPVTLMFSKAIEVTADDVVRSYWPLSIDDFIVIDPNRCYGQPIVAKEGVPTIVLATAVRAEQSIDKVSLWYEVAPSAVKSAYNYELNITKRLAA